MSRLLAAFFLVFTAATARAAVPNLTAVEVATGLYQPTGVFWAPGDDTRMYITEQWTRNVVLVKNGIRQATPFLTLPAVADNSVGNEIGLLSIAFDPDYASNGYVYVDYNPPPQTIAGTQYFTVKVVRYTRSAANPDIVDPASAVDVISVTKQAQNHNGSFLAFNPRDLSDPVKRHYLHVSFGDGGGGGDGGPGHSAIGNGQSTRTLLGKIVRIDVDPASHPNGGYSIPADNPTLPVSTADGLSGPSLREIFIMGLRNPWRASFDRANGDLYIGDVGDTTQEEIDILPYGQQAGANLGWAIREGLVAGTRPTVTPVVTPLRDPAYAYQRGAAIGGFVYRGATASMVGTYFFADYGGSGTMGCFTPDPAGNTATNVVTSLKTQIETALGHGLGGNVSSWGQDNAGELYFCCHNGNPANATSVYLLRADSALKPPAFSTTPPTAATVGFAYSYAFTVSGNPAPTLSLDQAPAGLVISGNTLQWANPTLGNWPVILRAANGQAPDAIQSFTLAVAGLRAGDAVAAADLENGLWVSRYNGTWNALPDFDGLTAIDCVKSATVVVDATTQANAQNANYGLRFAGFINVTNPGVYQFFLSSDDGSRMRIGDKVIIDNDGPHGTITQSGSIGLDIGLHRFSVEYFQGGGGANCALQWIPPGGTQQIAIPTGSLKRWITAPGVDVASRLGPYLGGTMPTSSLGTLPATLSATGAFRNTAAMVPAAGVVPYQVNSPLWSDATSKWRWIAVPDGTAATFNPAGNWTFPVGTVLVKHFEYPGKRVETRLLVVTPTGAYGVTYRWRADNSDADLVSANGTDEVLATSDGSKPWHYPTQNECMQCHTPVAGYVLGARTEQLNMPAVAYGSTGRSADQLRTLAKNGMVAGWSEGASYAALANVADTAQPLDKRARSYLQSNCSMCHQPGGPTPAMMDFRYYVDDGQGHPVVPQANYIGVAPSNTLGIANAKIVAPGSVATSVLYQRIISVDPAVRMPPLARQTVDATGTGVVNQWIAALGGQQANLPPTAAASGSASAITLPANQVTLTGSASDPEGHALSYAWSVASGTAANVSFANASALSTTATFAAAGTYVLRLTVTDDAPQSATADVSVTVNPASAWATAAAIDCGKATGTPITADGITWALDTTMGADRVEGPADFLGTTTLDAVYQTNKTGGDFTYTFSGLAAGTYRARVLTTEVYFTQAGQRVFKVSANGTVIASGIDAFALAGAKFTASEVATATFSPDANGAVALRFQATADAALVTAIVLERSGAANQPPTVGAATSSAAITLPANQVTLTGTASDPEGRSLTYAWSVASGTAANVAFATPTALSTSATFSAAGTYVLRLTATDDLPQSRSADVTVTVSPAAGGSWVTAAAIDCGKATGTPITADGITWSLDTTMGADRVEGPADFLGTTTLDAVYQTNKTGGDFTYAFTGLAAGTYRARVLTTEVYFTQAGKRVFNVSANGAAVANGIDAFALAGAKFTASEIATATFAPDANGAVALRFQATADAALVCAVVIERQGAGNQPPTVAVSTSAASLTLPANQATLTGTASDPEGRALTYAWSVASGTATNVAFAAPTAASTTATFAAAGTYVLRLTATDDLPQSRSADVTVTVNPAAGGGWSTVAAIDSGKVTGTPITADGITWALDATMAADRAEGPADFAGTTTLDAVYQTNRTGGDFSYAFTGLPAGTYRARVLTTEVWFTQAGSRVFSVSANGVTVAPAIDPWALAGAQFTAAEVATATFAPDATGAVTLRFLASADQALVCAVVLEAQVPNQPPTATASTSAGSMTLPANQVTLSGTAADSDGTVAATAWSVASGTAANVAFAAPAALSTTATFSAAGTYVLRLTVTDNAGASATANVQVVVNPAAALAIQVNFQPNDAAAPSGWLADTGSPYGARGNGQTYGWTVGGTPTDIGGAARRRNAANSPDVQHDTLIHMAKQNPAAVWEIAVPNGTYDVDLVCGDPGYVDMTHNMVIEGSHVRDPDGQGHWDEFLVRVPVTDGKLTVAMDADGANAKVDAITITPVPTAPQ